MRENEFHQTSVASVRSGPLPLVPNSMRTRASVPNSVSGRNWRPASFRFHLPLNSGNPKNVPGSIRAGSYYSPTYSTRKMFTDQSGFRSTTRGVPRPEKCSLAYLRSRLCAVDASSSKDVHGSIENCPMREMSARRLGPIRSSAFTRPAMVEDLAPGAPDFSLRLTSAYTRV